MGGVILYGPPAAGKDTVTRSLAELSPAYTLFPRMKCGPGRTTGYRMVSASYVDAMRRSGDIIWENERYGATYVVDRPFLLEHLATGVPVLHLGQVEAVSAVVSAIPQPRWTVVHLWCSLEVAVPRIIGRRTGDVEARIRAWRDTAPLLDADCHIDTGVVSPDEAALRIHRRVTGDSPGAGARGAY